MSQYSKKTNRLVRTIDDVLHMGVHWTLNRLPRDESEMRPRLLADIPYVDDGSWAHMLDVWVPPPSPGPSPVVIYIHGGGFAVGSKETHRIAWRMFARRGFLTFLINYRPSPAYHYPAALEDACTATAWIWDNLDHFGGDRKRIAVAGESAGGHLTTMMALVNSYKRPETFCRRVWEREIPLRAAIPWCGWYFVGEIDYYRSHPQLRYFSPILRALAAGYMGRSWRDIFKEDPLTNPFRMLRSPEGPDRPLPPFFIPIGTLDPLYFDSLQLKKELDLAGAEAELKIYPWAPHGFHVMPFTPQQRQGWRDVTGFLRKKGMMEGKEKAVKNHRSGDGEGDERH